MSSLAVLKSNPGLEASTLGEHSTLELHSSSYNLFMESFMFIHIYVSLCHMCVPAETKGKHWILGTRGTGSSEPLGTELGAPWKSGKYS